MSALVLLSDREHLLRRSDVVSGLEEGQLVTIELESPGQFADTGYDTEPSAHVAVPLPWDREISPWKAVL